MVLELKPLGKLVTIEEKIPKYKTEQSSCMVLGLKPVEKRVTLKEKISKY